MWAIRFNLSIYISNLIFKKKLKKSVDPDCFVPNNFEMNVAEYKKIVVFDKPRIEKRYKVIISL